MRSRLHYCTLMMGVLSFSLISQSRLVAETISIDFNTFALKGEKAEMQGPDPSFDLGQVWNQAYISKENNGDLTLSALKNSEGMETAVSLRLNAEKMTSLWTTERNLMPESKVYLDYVGLSKGTTVEISGLQPNKEYQIGIMGYPLSHARVALTLNGEELTVKSGLEWSNGEPRGQKPAGILKVVSDANGKISGSVGEASMWSGLHITTENLSLSEEHLVYLEPEAEVERAPQFPPSKQVTYKTVGDVELVLDIYHPKDFSPTDKRPAIVFFHGGSWSGGWKTQFSPQCHYLASRGMVAITAEYRVSSRHKTNPSHSLMDAKSAMRYIRKNAESLGINPDQIVAGGGSAGGHLAAAAAYTDAFNEPGEDLSVSCRPVALVLFNPVIDNSPGGKYPYGPQPMSENWEKWSPMHNIGSGEAFPTIFFLGDQDHLIPVATGEEYKKVTEAAGAECQFFVYPGARHSFFNGGPNMSSTLYHTDRFLAKHGFLNGEPTVEDLVGVSASSGGI